ncbi:hypothetical protein SD70_22010 [Gordoniibacillus kamchatkensis]|uniref:DUF4083 domain-containing protein n=1 Tax=Gordoniibacillus kamchatkensis TaxID=1590651 RepID=A0ABR5AE00_9BACL|nr:hypothetical protein [Paenibacillus sp. VKM B-2647]KIL39112.1 hypothetical protein SD70_22010 [Paenibacillus sp. VKM B-2647]
MHVSIWTLVIQVLSLLFWLFIIAAVSFFAVNAYKSRRSLQNIEALLKEIKQGGESNRSSG